MPMLRAGVLYELIHLPTHRRALKFLETFRAISPIRMVGSFDACYDRGGTFRLQIFLNDELPTKPKIFGSRPSTLHSSHCAPWQNISSPGTCYVVSKYVY